MTIGTNSAVTDLRVDNVQINGNTVTTTSGNLVLDSQNGRVELNDVLDVSVRAEIDNVRIDGNTVDTMSGKLILDSQSGEVEINDNVDLNGSLDLSAGITGTTATFTGDVIAFSSSDLTMKENV